MRLLAYAALLCIALTGGPAHAAGVDPGNATPVQREQAQSRFLRGRQLYEAGSYTDAIVEFGASNEIVASPNTRLYLARSLREAGRLVEAYVELGRTAVEAGEHAKDDSRYDKAASVASKERDNLAPKLGFVTVHVDHATDATVLSVGGARVARAAWTEPFPVMPGATEIMVERPGRAAQRQSVQIAAGEQTVVTVDATKQTGGDDARAAPPPASPRATSLDGSTGDASDGASINGASSNGHVGLRPYAYVAGGLGVAGLATFTIAGLMSQSTYAELERTCPGGKCPASASDAVDRGRTQQAVANVGLVVGVVGAAAGVTLFVLARKTSVAPSPASASAAGAHVLLSTSPASASASPVSARVLVGPAYTFVMGTF